ncbi:hypothetical protein FHP25_32750 [Vineibacter terrae]|uniref:Uncharacterized protein n=1 Tax=Vineibacter terrae TaxID=2586908 RepID=A0A5C8PBE3_9HYPH|nr:hypothetical protein [Vineibacter terrae]TXL70889.1 hypothetical protein FHP25_32750 [Vineibacter terrae]
MAQAQAVPVLISNDNIRCELARIRLGSGMYDESWLQELIHNHPAMLPMSDIEPGFGELIAAAREVPCGHGSIDNLYLTPSGDIVVVETKLWRNSEMRRTVVAQTLDYIAALGAMSYDDLQKAVARGKQAAARLYDLVRDHPEALEEAEFIDAVARNLRRGRMVAIIVGDGIRAETEALSSLLQSHAGSHFTFALVELATWRSAKTGDILAVPSTLAKTVMIERGIVRIEQGVAVVHPVPKDDQRGPQTISLADFWEEMAKRAPTLPANIRSFLAALEPLGVYPDLKASLNIKADLADRERSVNFGYIQKSGQLWTNPASWDLPEGAWKPYLETLAGLIEGKVVTGSSNYVSTNGRSAPRIEQFLPKHTDAFVAAIETMLQKLKADRLLDRAESGHTKEAFR